MLKRLPKATLDKSLISGILLVLTTSVWADEAKNIYLPLPFSSEAKTFKTTACLKVSEHTLTAGRWWEQDKGLTPNSAEDGFKNTLNAILKKDKTALLNASHSTLGHDQALFDSEAAAFFNQFSALQLTSVAKAYYLDGLVVFYPTAKLADGREFSFPMLFAPDNNVYKFLPYRSEILTFTLLNEWFNSPWGPMNTPTPSFCDDKALSKATHKIALIPAAEAIAKNDPSELYLTGNVLEVKKDHKGLDKSLVELLASMKKLDMAKPKEFAEFSKHMTLEGGNRLKEWNDSASAEDRIRYKNELFNVTPLFVFDLDSLKVVYVKSGERTQVMYFTYDEKHNLVWTNSSHITLSDKIYKRGVLFDNGLTEKPFADIKIH